jgi:hypothetical protein
MLQRVLAVSFAQVFRTVAILLLPLGFISLIAWEQPAALLETLQIRCAPPFGYGLALITFPSS